MKIILIFATCIALGFADIGLTTRGGGYSSSRPSSPSGTYLPPRSNQRETVVSADNYVPKVYKHVYVHTAPDEEAQPEKRVIRVNGGDKHVNIIFVKAPSQSGQSQTEVVLPDPDEQKNIVYVLLKKNTANDDVKITRPEPKAPTKPEVHFIRYNNGEEAISSPVEQQGLGIPAGLFETPENNAVPAPPAPAPAQPSGLYGTPSAQALSPPTRTQSVRTPSRVYGTPEDVPPLAPIREPSGLYGTPSQ